MQGGVPGDGAMADARVAEIESTVRVGVSGEEDCDVDAARRASWASSLLIVSRVM
jgi:hypothetical protein